MRKSEKLSIVGAGPTGLAAALFLSDRGIRPRIIEKLEQRTPFSKAFAINPKTLSLLEDTGLTEVFLNHGRKMPAMNFWKMDKHLFRNDFSLITHRYPFLLIQSQRDTEDLMEQALDKRGIKVERGIELKALQFEESIKPSNLRLILSHGADSENEVATTDYVLGADGAHSTVRHQLGVEWVGHKYGDAWELLDVELDTSLEEDEGHVIITPGGGILLIRIKEKIWRLAAKGEGLLERLPPHTRPGKIHWQSQFQIHHRMAKHLRKGSVFLAGDAAHLHSPLGARGMNLGIEDSHVFASCFAESKEGDYERSRLPIIRRTVRRVNAITQFSSSSSLFSRAMRAVIQFLIPLAKLAIPSMRKFILDVK